MVVVSNRTKLWPELGRKVQFCSIFFQPFCYKPSLSEQHPTSYSVESNLMALCIKKGRGASIVPEVRMESTIMSGG